MADAHWLEVSVVVDGELAEAVADVIGRYTSQGVVMEQAVKFNDAEDQGTPYGPIRVYGYLVIDSTTEQKRQHLEEALWHLGTIQPIPPVTYKTVDDQDWMEAWKQHYHPIPVGQKLLILPAWLESTDLTRIAIKIDPSMAFGTGTHPTTQLCLALLEKHVQPGKAVIDIGCGSGILSIGALKLGASQAICVDIDSAAIRSTLENGAANDVAEKIEAGVGSVDEVLEGDFAVRHAPLVLANILAPVIIRLLGNRMADLVSPGGYIIFSGILDTQSAEVEGEAEMHGLQFVEKMLINDWVGLVYHRPSNGH